MASLFVNETLPTTSEEAIRQFNEKYLMLLSAAPPSDWAQRFITSVGSPRTTFPMSFMSTKFIETKETEGRFTGMEEKSFDLKVKMFSAGYEALALDLTENVFAYRNWMNIPGRFVTAEQRHMAFQLAALLELGSSTASPFDDVNFFSASHLANPFSGSTTWSNLSAGGLAPTLTNIEAEMVAMQLAPLDENGDKLQARPNEIWLPTNTYQTVANDLNQAFLATGESNPITGQLKPVHVPELTDVNDWYLVDTNLMSQGFDPLLGATYRPSATLGLQVWDESSDFYKDNLKLKIKANIWTGFGLVYPHAIRKVVGA
jgi:hypothetical protein